MHHTDMSCGAKKTATKREGYLDDSLLGDGAGPALAYVKPLLHRETAAVGIETLHQQVVDSSKVVVTLVLERLDTGMLKLQYVTFWATLPNSHRNRKQI